MNQMSNIKDHWNANLYDVSHSFVSTFGNHLIDLLEPKKGERILDLGCGTGDLSNKLYHLGVHVIGIDKSENMIHQAKTKYPQITFKVNDAINFEFKSPFDAIFSNATLHWVKPPKAALHCIYNNLKQGGRFVAEFGGKGNVEQIMNEVKNQYKRIDIQYNSEKDWYFPSIGEYSTLMEEVGFQVTFAQHFDRPTPLNGENGLRNWMEMFCYHMFEDLSKNTKEQIIKNVESNLNGMLYHNRTWIADYKRIRVIGIK